MTTYQKVDGKYLKVDGNYAIDPACCCNKGCPTGDIGSATLTISDLIDILYPDTYDVTWSALNYAFAIPVYGGVMAGTFEIDPAPGPPHQYWIIYLSYTLQCLGGEWILTIALGGHGDGEVSWRGTKPASGNAWPVGPWTLTYYYNPLTVTHPYPETPITVTLTAP